MKKTATAIIRFYQYFSKTLLRYNALPFLFNSQCRYYPSCSEYAIEVINEYGFIKGTPKALGRVLKCNPFSKI